VRSFGAEVPNLSGQLLIAHPNLRDPNFRRTVLLLSAHDREEGAHGLVVNRPTNKALGDFLPDQEFKELEKVPVYLGGPVGTHELTIVSFEWVDGETKVTFHSQLSLSDPAETWSDKVSSLRAFVGYAGWTGGQLESELRQSAWIVHPATESILSRPNGDQTWIELMKGLGPGYYLLALAPDDPSLN
jgi:putative transcriptional regulator